MELSVRERDRMAVLRQVDEGILAATGAARLGVTRCHFRRLMRRFEAEGDGAAVHRLRGRRSNRALAPEVRERVLALAADRLQAGFGPTLLAEHARRRLGVRAASPPRARCPERRGDPARPPGLGVQAPRPHPAPGPPRRPQSNPPPHQGGDISTLAYPPDISTLV